MSRYTVIPARSYRRVAPVGLEARFVWSNDDLEAMLESTLVYRGTRTFDERGIVHVAPGHTLRIRGHGRLDPSPLPGLRHGTVVWEVVGGTGSLAGTEGRTTSNVLLSDTGDLTESQLGVLFTRPRA